MKKILILILFLLYSCEDDGLTPIYGCTDINSLDYDSNANFDNGSCSSYPPDYTNVIQSIFDANCTMCHDGTNPDGGLDLSSYVDLMNGGNSGDAVITGDALNSNLWQRISDYSMPPNFNLLQHDIDLIEIWINAGANP